jgi:hypothetical protein
MIDLTPEEMIEKILRSLRKTGERFAPRKTKEKLPAKIKSRRSSSRSRAQTGQAGSSQASGRKA